MATTSERDAAAALAARIKTSLIDSSLADEAHRPRSDRPPSFADALMSEAPASVERAAHLGVDDWALIARALEHYAASAGR